MKIPFHQHIKDGQKLAVHHAPAILTGAGITGTVATAALVGKATWQAAYSTSAEDAARHSRGEKMMTRKEIAAEHWKLYIPAAGVGAGTVTAVFFANRISSKRLAAVAAAYTITERAYSEYKEKVVETIGKNKDEKIRAAVQQERIDRDPVDGQVLVMTQGKVLCKDAWSGRYFESSMEDIKEAQNNLNHQIINHQYASLTDFYCQLALESTKESDNLGWNSDALMEVMFTSGINSKNEPVLVMDFAVAPTPEYFRGRI